MAEPNFSRESKNIIRLFIREFYQNVIDARSDDPRGIGQKLRANVRVRVLDKSNGLDTRLLQEILGGLHPHLSACGHIVGGLDYDSAKVLILEEFSTKGLTGITDNSFAEGEEERWKNFWFGEGLRSKTRTSLGRAGQGKITYHIVSEARTLLALTRRDGDPKDYLFGKCIVRDTHAVDGRHFTHHGYWPKVDPSNGQPLPETDQSFIERIKNGFRLERKSEAGTSWIIPFVPESFSEGALAREFLGDFFFSVLTDGVSVLTNGWTIDSSSIQDIFTAENIEEPSREFFEFLVDCVTSLEPSIEAKPEWCKSDNISEECFEESQLETLRADFKMGKVVSVKMPIEVKSKTGGCISSYITAFLQTGDNLKHVEELYVRSGLVIAEEQHLAGETGAGFGLVMANDPPISEFLGYCEVASHLKWNAKEQPAVNRYASIQATLSSVRNSLPKLFRLLAGSNEDFVEDALDDILSLPAPVDDPARKKPRPKRTKPVKPRLVRPKPMELFSQQEPRTGEWRLLPGADANSKKVKYPLERAFTFAYDRVGGSGNPFLKWHPFDFDLSDGAFHPVTCKNVQVVKRSGQKLYLKILSPKFDLRVSGFSKHQRLLVKAQ